ncbi:hypothetical protein Hanom_Chr16g01476441 [Helianthus anomalus]
MKDGLKNSNSFENFLLFYNFYVKRHSKFSKMSNGQRYAFANYLICKQHPSVCWIKKAKTVRQKMEWRTQYNLIDSVIFTMRHMETYMGQLSGWACGLPDENALYNLQNKQLNDLRIKYITKILLHNLNES